MNLNGLTLRNLLYHARANLAVVLGVAVGTAVLTGALLVGDSLRASLARLTEDRLGWVEQALVGGRFLRQEIAADLDAPGVAPVLLLRGTATADGKIARKVQIVGVEARFWNKGEPGGDAAFWNSSLAEAVLNDALARELEVSVGGKVELSLLKASDIPRETLLGDREGEAAVGTATLTVARTLGPDDAGDKFSLQPSLDTVRTVFVPLAALQQALDQPGKVNGFLLRGADPGRVAEQVQAKLTLDDLGLKLIRPTDRADALMKRLDRDRDGVLTGSEWYRPSGDKVVYRLAGAVARAVPKAKDDAITRDELRAHFAGRPFLTLESKAFLIEPAFEAAARSAAKTAGLTPAPVLVYLANTLAEGDQALPYVLVAGVDPTLPPLGKEKLPDDHVLLAKWPESPLANKPGDKVKLVFYPPEQHGDYQEKTVELTSAGSVDLAGSLVDPELTPEFPGVTDKDDVGSWKPPFKFDSKRVKAGDLSDRFWQEYRTTPRAYVNLATAEKLFGSRYGKATSVRLLAGPGTDLDKAAETFRKAFLGAVTLEQLGLVVQSVRADGLKASGGAMNFAGLFLGFSFFLIAAALLLVGLLFRLNLERRAKEIGLLATSGYRPVVLRGLLLREGALLAVVGAVVGCLFALLYSRLLIQLMQLLWPGGMLDSFLRPSWTGLSLLIGGAASVLVALGTIWWVVRGMAKVPPRLLIAGKTKDETDPASLVPPPARPPYGLIGCVALGVVLLGVAFFVPGHEAQAGTFFGSGALFLTAGLLLVSRWLKATSPTPLRPDGGLGQLALRNLARNPGRSLLTVGLLAAAAFLLVAVESFRRTAHAGTHDKAGPDGGFALVGESELPVVRDLNSEEGRGEILDALQADYQKRQVADRVDRLRADRELLGKVEVVALRVRDGDDASCLNLYEPRRPRVLGVPRSLIERGGFVFGATAAGAPENPWLLLDADSEAVPAFGEQNTVMWQLQSGLGGTVSVPDATGTPATLRIAGLLKDSVFQSALLVSERRFLGLYPGQEGFRFFLIACPPGTETRVKDLLQTALAGRGFSATTSAEKLAGYLAIENTYLSTFQALGGLGLVLGSLGLAVVLLRSVWERQGELALLQALGYRHGSLNRLILIENATLLGLGLVVGTAAAFLSVAPQLVAGTATLPWGRLGFLLGLVLLVGLTATVLATWAALRQPLQPALRRE